MDAEVVWKEEFNIGVDIIDKEHERLFKIINRLFKLEEEGKDSQWTCQEGIKFFKSHAVKHFEDEETYMESVNYEGLERHRLIHKGFRENTLPALEQELERTGYSSDSVEHFLSVCTGWLIGHTLTEDQAITGKKASMWKNLLPGEQLTATKKLITQLLFDMFHLEAQVISDAYGGEKFGSGVYHRLVYGTDQDEKRFEIIMVFEEKLLINTVGKIMGIKTNKLEAMLLNASRYTSQQLAGRILKHFPALKPFELKEENLLNYEEFQNIFEQKTPQISLLFNTGGAGYFAYCVIESLQLHAAAAPIENKIAMTEVEKYLKEQEQEAAASKRKVLVVDDSMTMRQALKQMLSEDYEVGTAESGVAAIRAITLNKPDLILLDYEMPVCDGKQTLEMIRSDEAFSKIPVIFLTSKRDTESMIKVMPLKPAGYLLKTTKPADIKKEIDAFFEKK